MSFFFLIIIAPARLTLPEHPCQQQNTNTPTLKVMSPQEFKDL